MTCCVSGELALPNHLLYQRIKPTALQRIGKIPHQPHRPPDAYYAASAGPLPLQELTANDDYFKPGGL